jgi:hypothetical protein
MSKFDKLTEAYLKVVNEENIGNDFESRFNAIKQNLPALAAIISHLEAVELEDIGNAGGGQFIQKLVNDSDVDENLKHRVGSVLWNLIGDRA